MLQLASLTFAVLSLAVLRGTYGQTTYSQPIDNISPRDASSVCYRPNPDGSGRTVTFVADLDNSCWYWACRRVRGRVTLLARNCALGTSVSDFFSYGSDPPCSELLTDPSNQKFFCRRKNFLSGPPPCFQEYQQQGTCNSGRIEVVYSRCSCDCTGTGFADWDCSKLQENLIGASVVPSLDDPCPNGIPRINHCVEASVNGVSPCQNNGQCRNECLNYTCLCIPPFTAGRNCEAFSCSVDEECMNGGVCDRGLTGMDQTPTCNCLPGTTGLMCEIRIVS